MTTKKETAVTTAPQASPSERFAEAVQRELGTTGTSIQVTPFQKKLIQNYFIKTDMVLKAAELKRTAKPESSRDPVPLTWNNVNMKQLALDCISFSAIGLDPLQPNHINIIPYKNNAQSLYDLTFVIGYNGCELKAKKYGLEIPDNVIIEIVKENDTFKPIKRDLNNKSESYTFDIGTGFNRGNIIGGFYYYEYFANPEKNKLVIFSLEDIEKRKPKYASAEFWGGEKDKWENGKKAGKEKIEGWHEEMCRKTIKRAAYNAISIDSEKIDQHLVRMMQAPEAWTDSVEERVHTEIETTANQKELTMPVPVYEDAPEVVDEQTGEVKKDPALF